MPFFPVDDDFAFSRKAIAAGNAAIGLWTRAGAFCMKEATDGVVRREELTGMGTPGQARKLVEARLWHAHGHSCPRCPQPPRGGWIFHDWTETGPLKSADQIKARREADRQRQQRHRSRGQSDSRHAVTGTVMTGVSHGADHAVSPRPPSPSPSVVVTPVSPLRSVTRGMGLTDEDIEKIKTRLRCDDGHARRVADLVLSKAQATVARPARYVLAAIDAEPDLYRQARRNTADEQCPTHPGSPKPPFCGGCRFEQIEVR